MKSQYKTLTMLAIAIISICYQMKPVSAYVIPEHYINETPIKFYGKFTPNEKTQCIDMMHQIPVEYYEGIRYVRITKKQHVRYAGVYVWASGIDLYSSSCELGVMVHELAHHKQYTSKSRFYYAVSHSGKFTKYENLIHQEVIKLSVR